MRRLMSIDKLKATLDYDPETGVIRWLERSAWCVQVGQPIESVCDHGYVRFNVAKVSYYAHQVAWAWMTGAWPTHPLDHINGNRLDNRWANLRKADKVLNGQNQRKPHKQNSTGFLGVSRDGKKYRAQITVNMRTRKLGTFETPEQAHEAYIKAKRELHPGCTI